VAAAVEGFHAGVVQRIKVQPLHRAHVLLAAVHLLFITGRLEEIGMENDDDDDEQLN